MSAPKPDIFSRGYVRRSEFTPRLVELTYEAALKSYWRKEALKKLLRASDVSENFLATWGAEESKRDFLDKAFQKLQASDKGKAVIFEMARSLSEQTTFPDLRNWEDSPQKIADATNAIAELKAYLKAQDQEIQNEKEKEDAKTGARETRQQSRLYSNTIVQWRPVGIPGLIPAMRRAARE